MKFLVTLRIPEIFRYIVDLLWALLYIVPPFKAFARFIGLVLMSVMEIGYIFHDNTDIQYSWPKGESYNGL